MARRRLKQNDGAYTNLVTALGTGSDKDTYTKVDTSGLGMPNYGELGAQYAKDGIVARLTSGPLVKALKTPFTIDGDKDGKIWEEMSRLGFVKAIKTAGTYARLFGGSLIVTLYEGSDNLETRAPASGKVVGYRVFSCARCTLEMADLVDKADSEYFNNVELYPIRKRNGEIQKVHASRVQVIHGNLLPDSIDTDLTTEFFGTSEVLRVNDGIMRIAPAIGGLSNMLQENGLAVYSLDGLARMMAAPDGVNKIRERMSVVKLGMSSMRAVFQDKNDSFEMKSHSFSDMHDSIKALFEYTSALSGIPVSILFGNTVSGLSNTNEGDIRQYDDLVDQYRTEVLYEPMCAMIGDFCKRNGFGKFKGSFQFGDLSQMSATEKAEWFGKRVDAAEKLVNMGAMTGKEVRENLLVNGTSSEWSVSSSAVPAQPQEGARGGRFGRNSEE